MPVDLVKDFDCENLENNNSFLTILREKIIPGVSFKK